MTFFSIIVPAYNAQDTLAETLDAVLAQTYSSWECVVVDDGSVDETCALAEAYRVRDDRFRVISQENRGTGGAYNTGVSHANGDWVAICSADDILLPGLLETMNTVLEQNPGYGILSCNGYFLRPDGSTRLVYGDAASRLQRSWSLEEVFERCFFSVGACYRRGIFEEIGGYLEDAYGEDYDFWLRAMAAGARHLYVPDALSIHRISATQKSANHIKAFESDIRSISGVLNSFELTRSQRGAAKAAIRQRRRLISEESAPRSLRNRIRNRLSLLKSRMGG